MRVKKWVLLVGGSFVLLLTSCSHSPMKYRLDNNFVYQCSLELIDEDVPASEAERVCTASHRAEMLEAGIKSGAVKKTPVADSEVVERSPASLPPPVLLSE